MLCREQQMVAKPTALLVQGTLSRHPRDLRMVVLLRKMRQDKELGCSIIVARQKICECVIRQVTDAAHHSLLHAPRIRTAAQLLDIVVGLDHQNMTSAQVVAHIAGNVSEIGADANLDAIAAKGEAHWVDGVMRDGERRHRDVTDLEYAARTEMLDPRQLDAVAGTVAGELPIGVIGGSRDVNRNLQPLGQHAKSADVIAMLVRNYDGVDAMRVETAQPHAVEQLSAGKTGVHQ